VPEDSFTDLMSHLRDGDQAAAAFIFRRFARRLIGLAYHRLDALIRQKEDPEDVVQSVFKSFFARQTENPYTLEDWDSLWSLLARITAFKCGHRIVHFHAARRDVRRDVAAAAADSPDDWEAAARDPTPVEAAVLIDTVESLMRELGERDRRIFSLSLQGCSDSDIAAQVPCSERTVRRVLGFVKNRLEEMRGGAEGP
jgi:RNA polymerase sigma factor (sigma-70 family)